MRYSYSHTTLTIVEHDGVLVASWEPKEDHSIITTKQRRSAGYRAVG